MLNHLSLFSGYEGFGLGLRLAGLPIRTVDYLEIDDYCQRVLQVRMADGVLDHAPIIRDITACDFRPMAGLVDIITAGFPCQPHSVAGLRAGAHDGRNLWPDTLRVIGDVGPGIVVLENVPGILANGYGGTVVGQLAEIGYDCRWAIVSAAEVGAPHRRNRWWCLATLADASGHRRIEGREPNQRQSPGGSETLADTNGLGCGTCQHHLSEGQSDVGRRCSGIVAHSDGQRQQQSQGTISEQRRRACDGGEEVAHASSPRCQGVSDGAVPMGSPHAGSVDSGRAMGHTHSPRCERRRSDRIRQAQPESGGGSELADAQGLTDGRCGQPRTDARGVSWWQVEPPLGRVVDGCPDRVASIRALGNGIVPAVVAEFLRMIAP